MGARTPEQTQRCSTGTHQPVLVYHEIMAKAKNKTSKSKPRVNESQVDSGGGVASIMGGGVMPGNYGPNRPDTTIVNVQSGETSSYPYYDFPDPYKPRKPVRPAIITRYTPPGVPKFPVKVPTKKKPGLGRGSGSSMQGFD